MRRWDITADRSNEKVFMCFEHCGDGAWFQFLPAKSTDYTIRRGHPDKCIGY